MFVHRNFNTIKQKLFMQRITGLITILFLCSFSVFFSTSTSLGTLNWMEMPKTPSLLTIEELFY